MEFKKSLKSSAIVGWFSKLKSLAKHSLIFNVSINKDNKGREYKSWKETSIVFSILTKKDNFFRNIEKNIKIQLLNSKLTGNIFEKLFSEKKNKSNLLASSKLLQTVGIDAKVIKWNQVLILLPTLYVLLDYLIRRIPVIMRLGSVWDEMLLLLLAIIYIFSRIKSGGKVRFNFTAMDLPIVIYIILGVSHVLIKAPDIGIAIEGFRSVFQHILWYFIFTQYIKTIKDSEVVINGMLSLGLFLGVHAVYQYIAKVPMPGNWVDTAENISTRAFSIIGSPNILGVIFVLFIPIGISMILTKKNKFQRLFYITATIFMIAGLLFTMSRGAWLAFAFAMAIFTIALVPRLIVPFAGVGAGFVLFGGGLSERLLYMLSPVYLMKSAAGGRLYRWAIGLELWRKNQVFGVGLGRYGGAVAMNNNLTPFYLDNYYLKTLTEMGIYGIAALSFLIVSFIVFAIKIIRTTSNHYNKIMAIGLFSGAMGVLAQNFVENIFEVPAMVVYFYLAVALLNCYANEKDVV
ncbi:MAG: O-antigen ligase family protein [Gudongella sp.]|nr:O-antigen ligase family protein [Gudongella sp.]